MKSNRKSKICASFFLLCLFVPVSFSYAQWFERDISASFKGVSSCCDQTRREAELEGVCNTMANAEAERSRLVIQRTEVIVLSGDCTQRHNPITGVRSCDGTANGKCRYYLAKPGNYDAAVNVLKSLRDLPEPPPFSLNETKK
jgi:hypothetical protein